MSDHRADAPGAGPPVGIGEEAIQQQRTLQLAAIAERLLATRAPTGSGPRDAASVSSAHGGDSATTPARTVGPTHNLNMCMLLVKD